MLLYDTRTCDWLYSSSDRDLAHRSLSSLRWARAAKLVESLHSNRRMNVVWWRRSRTTLQPQFHRVVCEARYLGTAYSASDFWMRCARITRVLADVPFYCCIRSNFRHATPILIVRRYGCWMPRRLVFSRPYYRSCLCIIWVCLSACCLSDPNVLMAQYLENSWTRYLATIANY